MAGANSGRIPITFQDHYTNLEKAVLREGQRPLLRNAKDFMGPAFGPKAVEVKDWNDEVARFNGIVWSTSAALNTPPEEDREWIGMVMATPEGSGCQRIHSLFKVGEDHFEFFREFYTPVAEPIFTDWLDITTF